MHQQFVLFVVSENYSGIDNAICRCIDFSNLERTLHVSRHIVPWPPSRSSQNPHNPSCPASVRSGLPAVLAFRARVRASLHQVRDWRHTIVNCFCGFTPRALRREGKGERGCDGRTKVQGAETLLRQSGSNGSSGTWWKSTEIRGGGGRITRGCSFGRGEMAEKNLEKRISRALPSSDWVARVVTRRRNPDRFGRMRGASGNLRTSGETDFEATEITSSGSRGILSLFLSHALILETFLVLLVSGLRFTSGILRTTRSTLAGDCDESRSDAIRQNCGLCYIQIQLIAKLILFDFFWYWVRDTVLSSIYYYWLNLCVRYNI